MTIKLTCGDGAIVRIQREYFERSIFTNPDISAARSYTLRCKAPSDSVNALVDMADGESQTVTITEDNFEELQNLCEELGFRGLDRQLQAFKAGHVIRIEERLDEYEERLEHFETELVDVRDTLKHKVEDHDFDLARLKEQIRKYEELFQKVQRRLDELESEKSRLARDLAQLKENEKAATTSPATPVNPAPPTLGKRREFVYDSSKPLEGVIAYLTRECGGNVHDKEIVNVTASTVDSDDHHPKNAVDLGTDSYYHSGDEEDTWICYDFKERRVIPTSYSVRSIGWGPGSAHLKSWVIGVSNNGYSWTEIDRRDNNNDLNDEYATANFTISNVPGESFRFFRLKQTGENHAGRYYVNITALEIFGTLFEK